MRELGVGLRPSTMSFSVRCERCDLEFSGHGLGGLFAQRRNLVRPSFARMLLDLGRFFRHARSVLDDPAGDRLTIGEFLERGRYGHAVPAGAVPCDATAARVAAGGPTGNREPRLSAQSTAIRQ